jgi:hypothetical protein
MTDRLKISIKYFDLVFLTPGPQWRSSRVIDLTIKTIGQLQDQHRIQPDRRTPRLLSVLFPDRGKKPTCLLQLLVKSDVTFGGTCRCKPLYQEKEDHRETVSHVKGRMKWRTYAREVNHANPTDRHEEGYSRIYQKRVNEATMTFAQHSYLFRG